jgi:hypothetical protein
VQPEGSGAGKAEHHRLAAGCGQRRHGAVAQHLGAKAVGHDQAGGRRDDGPVHERRDGEIELVAEFGIERPFVIGMEVLGRGFDLDDPNLAPVAERHDVGAPAIGERQLAEAGKAALAQHAADAALGGIGGVGLAAVAPWSGRADGHGIRLKEGARIMQEAAGQEGKQQGCCNDTNRSKAGYCLACSIRATSSRHA